MRDALEIAVDRFQDAVVDREHAQTAYRRSCQKELEEAREALLAALSTKQEGEECGAGAAAFAALERARTVLGNMAKETTATIASGFKRRWPIHHEPLRADARNLLPIIDAALALKQAAAVAAEEDGGGK